MVWFCNDFDPITASCAPSCIVCSNRISCAEKSMNPKTTRAESNQGREVKR